MNDSHHNSSETALRKICRENPEIRERLDDLILEIAGALAGDKNFKPQVFEQVELSLVFPIFNEEENIPELYRRVSEILADLKVESSEILFVNDGSSDRSEQLIRELKQNDTRIKLINFSRNFGHQAAITAGIDLSRGNATILMDADLQDPPHVIGEMLKKWREGAEIVYAVRKKRDDDTLSKRFFAKSFYRVLQYVSNIDIPLDTGDFCLLDKVVVKQLRALPEKNRFLRGLRSWLGFRHEAVTFERPARFAGEPKYTFRQSFRLAVNGIVGFSSFPLRIAVYAGFFAFFAAVVLTIVAFTAYFLDVHIERGWTSIVVIVLFIGGTQLILLGSIGEYIGRIYDEAKQRPNYIIREFLD
ncbi:MAG: glycosyltransferase family 2 protein [Pyrinomonadaceae bacterium]